MTDHNHDGVPFRTTNYDYRVSLGTVMDRDAVSWSGSYRCSTWKEVHRLATMWAEARDYPAVEVELDYIPHRLPEDTEAGVP
jgi:hypothetical protein